MSVVRQGETITSVKRQCECTEYDCKHEGASLMRTCLKDATKLFVHPDFACKICSHRGTDRIAVCNDCAILFENSGYIFARRVG